MNDDVQVDRGLRFLPSAFRLIFLDVSLLNKPCNAGVWRFVLLEGLHDERN